MRRPTPGDPPTLPDCEPRRLVSDLFHKLSQPLTSLCCSLELALQQNPSADPYVALVSRALEHAKKISWLVTSIRELFDADEARVNCEVLELQRAVQNAIGDLLPVAVSAGVRICYLPRSACPVWFDTQRLCQGLFHRLEFAVGSGGDGAAVRIDLEERGEDAVLVLTVSGACTEASAVSSDQGLVRQLGLGIARAIFEASGGSFSAERGVECLSVEVRLPRSLSR